MDLGLIQIYAVVLTIIIIALSYILTKMYRHTKTLHDKINTLNDHYTLGLEKVRKDSTNRQRATLKGQISEVIAPWLLESVDSVKELNFLGNPIDFIGFKGLDGDGDVEIKLIEVKTGNSRLNKNQRRVKDAVESKRLSWVEVRIQTEDIRETGVKIEEIASNGG